jgi:uncharacterized UPF0160 family protein
MKIGHEMPNEKEIHCVIVTHDSVYHADDLLACASALVLSPSASIFRTRSQSQIHSLLEQHKGEIAVLDVGTVYSEETDQFDHHQDKDLISCFGLFWKKYGEMVVAKYIAGTAVEGMEKEVAAIVKTNLVDPVDAMDVGKANLHAGNGVMHYTVSHVLASTNPAPDEADQDFDSAFRGRGLAMAQTILQRAIVAARNEAGAIPIARAAIASAADPRVIVIDEYADIISWLITESKALYLVFPVTDGTWRIQAIPPEVGSFKQRKPLPAQWSDGKSNGLRDAELQAATGVPDAIFCHNGMWTAGCASKEGVMRLSELACDTEMAMLVSAGIAGSVPS